MHAVQHYTDWLLIAQKPLSKHLNNLPGLEGGLRTLLTAPVPLLISQWLLPMTRL